MEMSEQEMMEELGVAPKENTSEEKQEAADSASSGNPDSEEKQEAADPASEEGKESKERDAIFASARRKAEESARIKIEEAQKRSDKKVNDIIRSLGIKDPVSGKVAENEEELKAFRRANDKENAAKQLGRLGITEEMIRGIVDAHPDVVRAKELADRIEKEAERADAAEYEKNVLQEIEKISKDNPKIKSFDDVYALPEYGEIYKLSVNNGLSLYEAYTLATHKSAVENAKAAARAQAKHEAGSKGHLKTSGGSTGEGINIPSSELARMKELAPGLSDEEYKKFYMKQKRKD